MSTELCLLGWTLVLALVQIMLASSCRTRETGMAYNLSARDADGPPMSPVTARLFRARANLYETLPLFAIALLIAHATNRESAVTLDGAWLYLLGRIAYVPLYAFGIPVARTLAWGVSLAGLVMILGAILKCA